MIRIIQEKNHWICTMQGKIGTVWGVGSTKQEAIDNCKGKMNAKKNI